MTTQEAKKLIKLQMKIISQMNFKNILERKKLGDKVSKKAGKEVIFMYDENFFCEEDEKYVEQWNEFHGYRYSAPTLSEIKFMKSEESKKLTCIIDGKQYWVMFENNKNRQVEREMINENCYSNCLSVAVSGGRRLFVYIFHPKSFTGQVLPELVEKYRDTYFRKLQVAERRVKIEELLCVV